MESMEKLGKEAEIVELVTGDTRRTEVEVRINLQGKTIYAWLDEYNKTMKTKVNGQIKHLNDLLISASRNSLEEMKENIESQLMAENISDEYMEAGEATLKCIAVALETK